MKKLLLSACICLAASAQAMEASVYLAWERGDHMAREDAKVYFNCAKIQRL